jgi:hypothetical protein
MRDEPGASARKAGELLQQAGQIRDTRLRAAEERAAAECRLSWCSRTLQLLCAAYWALIACHTAPLKILDLVGVEVKRHALQLVQPTSHSSLTMVR